MLIVLGSISLVCCQYWVVLARMLTVLGSGICAGCYYSDMIISALERAMRLKLEPLYSF